MGNSKTVAESGFAGYKEDPWEKLLKATEAEAKKRISPAIGGKDVSPLAVLPNRNRNPEDSGATVPEDPNRTVPEDLNRTMPEGPNRTGPDSGSFGDWRKGSLLLETYRVESDPILGGMGSVWRVHHLGWNVSLAMKRPRPEMFTDEASKRNFTEECRAWINLGLHPNIVSCYYVREIDGVPAIFSEWMENGSLENRIEDGTLYDGSEDTVKARLLDIAIQYARGLHYAHEAGLIHQDVKPDNLLLTKDWQARAADFGLARARAQLTVLEGATTLRDSGATLIAAAGGYTPAYCSMEQMDGKKLTRRTDIYSWAVSVMEMYYGSRPWTNGVVAGMSCRDYFTGGRVSMPAALCELLAGCMETEPENRPHDFAEIESELLTIWRELTGSSYSREKPRAAANTADSLNNQALSYLDLGMREKAEELWAEALAADPGHPDSLYNQGLLLWRNARISDLDLLERLSKVGDRIRGAELANRVHAEQDAESPCFLEDISCGKEGQVCFSPDGTRLILTSPAGGSFLVLDAVSGKTLGRVENGGAETGLALAPGNNVDIFWSSGKDALVRYDLGELEPTDYFANDEEEQKYFSFALNRDESMAVALLRNKREIASFEVPHAEVWDIRKDRRIFAVSCNLTGNVHMSPDGKRFAAMTADRLKPEVEVWDVSRQRAVLSMAGHKGIILDLAVSRDFSVAYTVSLDGTVRSWDLSLGTCIRQYPIGSMSGREQLYILPDRRLLLLNFGGRHLIRVMDPESGRLVSTFGEEKLPLQSCAAIHAGSDRIVIACEDGRVFRLRIPRKDRRADWSLSRIGSTGEYLIRERNFKKYLAQANRAFEERSMDDALRFLLLARNVPGYEVHPEALALARKLGPYREITGLRNVLKMTVMEGHRSPPSRLAVSGDGTYAVSACGRENDRQVLLWDLESGNWINQIASPMRCFSVAFHPEGNRVLIHSTEQIEEYQIIAPDVLGADGRKWRPYTKMVAAWSAGTAYIHNIFPAPDGMSFVAGVGQGFSVWRMDRKQPEYSREADQLDDLCLTPDGKTILICSKKAPLRQFDYRTGKELPSLPVRGDQVFCSPDGARIALTLDRTCTVLDARTGDVQTTFPLPWEKAAICFSHDSRMIWHPDENSLIRLRQIGDGASVAEIPGITEKVTALAADPAGRRLLAACQDHRILNLELDWDYR